MKLCRKCGEEKSSDSFHKDKTRDDGLCNHCKECRLIAAKSRYAPRPRKKKTKEEIRSNQNAWRKKNKERTRLANSAWNARNKDVIAKAQRKYSSNNRELMAKRKREYRAKNPHKTTAILTARKASKLNATPAWADMFVISEAYHIARLRSQMTGVKWHVDHIVPLRSGIVCGLHCEANLQVIPASLNCSKGNRHWPDMP